MRVRVFYDLAFSHNTSDTDRYRRQTDRQADGQQTYHKPDRHLSTAG